MSARLVLTYEQVGRSDSLCVGGKAWSTALLAQKSVVVPRGFCIARELTDELIGSNPRLRKLWENHFRGVIRGQSLVGAAREELESLVRKARMRGSSEAQISAALEAAIGGSNSKVIVRSSATVEDAASASFAGQFSSHVARGLTADVARAVTQCLESSVSQSVSAYAHALGVDLAGLGIGILVQEFLEFDFSGVLFTSNPIAAEPGFLIEFAPGNPDRLVSGRVTPGRCTFDPATGDVDWLRGSPHARSLPPRILRALGQSGARARECFGSEQDVEWGAKGSKVYILQSRPITAARKSPR